VERQTFLPADRPEAFADACSRRRHLLKPPSPTADEC
jgi:hypothetical protein